MDIKTAIKEIFDVVNVFISAKDENGPGGSSITLLEKFKIGIQGLDLVKVFSGLNQLVEDWKSRDPQKIEEWKQAFDSNFDIPNDDLESTIESLVNKAIELAGEFNNLHALKK